VHQKPKKLETRHLVSYKQEISKDAAPTELEIVLGDVLPICFFVVAHRQNAANISLILLTTTILVLIGARLYPRLAS